ncbi:hypothetical protein A3752_12165 [Oleiphilus sp. HI0081]|nr:hypothetical protein A3749_10790 [Oleiphilus sp. HI0078]KZZ20255.1 hypothetical protein A3752_12165 [Oleiphilus sp. HI0081]
MKSIRVVLVCTFLASLLFGCAALDSAMSTRGVISESVSKMDDKRVVRMSSVLTDSNFTELGLYWDSDKGDNAILIVQTLGAENFSPSKPFELKIDGKLVELQPIRKRDYGDAEIIAGSKYTSVHNISSKQFIISKDQIKELASANEAHYRLHLLNGKYREDSISYLYPEFQSYVPFSFSNFHSTVWE